MSKPTDEGLPSCERVELNVGDWLFHGMYYVADITPTACILIRDTTNLRTRDEIRAEGKRIRSQRRARKSRRREERKAGPRD